MLFKGKEHQGAGTAINRINEKCGYPRLIFGTDVASSQHNTSHFLIEGGEP